MDVRTTCLGILLHGDFTGYDIRKLVEDSAFSHFTEASYGSIYPALTRLTEEGLVTLRTEAARGGPEKKIYSITDAGRRAFDAALSGPLPEDRFRSPFLFAMLFAHLLPPERVRALVDLQIAYYRRKLAVIDAAASEAETPGDRLVAGLGRATFTAALSYLETHRSSVEAGRPSAAPARSASLEGQPS